MRVTNYGWLPEAWWHPLVGLEGGLGEIARVLRSGGRALVWDFRPS